MRGGGADYRDEARLEHMMRTVRRLRVLQDGEKALKPIVDALPAEPSPPSNLSEFL